MPNAGGKYYCSQKLPKQTYLSELALKHECKCETKQTLLVGSTCIFKQNVDTNVQIWRMKLRWEHCVGFQFHPDIQWIHLQYVCCIALLSPPQTCPSPGYSFQPIHLEPDSWSGCKLIPLTYIQRLVCSCWVIFFTQSKSPCHQTLISLILSVLPRSNDGAPHLLIWQ